MDIYPAIDIKEGKCVRLIQGKFAEAEIYSENLLETGLKWKESGAEYLHVVDLDAAKTGNLVNLEKTIQLSQSLNIPIQLGGGIRSLEIIEMILDKGINRVIIGTSAVYNQDFIISALKKFNSKIIIGIDAKDGLVAVEGWQKISNYEAINFAKTMEELGANSIIYTDISKDGMLQGPNFEAIEKMVNNLSIAVIASGGVSKIEDIIELKKIGVLGVVIGKALYTGKIDLNSAIKIGKGEVA